MNGTFFTVFQQDKTVIFSYPYLSFAAYIGRYMLYRSSLNCSLNHSAMGFRLMARLVRGVFHHLETCLFGREFPSVFLRVEFPCILQRLSLDERCGLPFIKFYKATKVFNTEHFMEIGKPCHLCDYYFQK